MISCMARSPNFPLDALMILAARAGLKVKIEVRSAA
jgi:hypothetical protein